MDYNVLLHPYRFLVVSVLSERNATVKELREELPEVPQAALYRSIKKLLESEIICIASNQKVRGAVESTYKINMNLSRLPIDHLNVDDLRSAAFMTYLSFVHRQIKHRLEKNKYNTRPVRINDNRMDDFVDEFNQLIEKYEEDDGECYQLTTFLVAKGD